MATALSNTAETPESEQAGQGFLARAGSAISRHINGSSARKVGFRYLFGDILVAASALIIGNTSKLVSSAFGFAQSGAFFIDAEKDKKTILQRSAAEIDAVLEKASQQLVEESSPDFQKRMAVLRAASLHSPAEKLWQAAQDAGVTVGSWSMVGAGASMVHSGIYGRDGGGPIIGEITNGLGNMSGFLLAGMKSFAEKPEGYDRYTVHTDDTAVDLLRDLGRGAVGLFRQPIKQSVSLVWDMLRYDPSQVGKYILATTSVSGLLAGVQEIFRGDARSRAAGVAQLGASLSYLWGELAMGNMSHEKAHGVIGSDPEADMRLLRESGFFRERIDAAIKAGFLREGNHAENDQMLDIIAKETVGSRYQFNLDHSLIKQGLQEAMSNTFVDYAIDGARS